MAVKHKTHDVERATVVQRTSKPAARTENEYEQVSPPLSALDRIVTKPPAALTPADILTLQRTVGNRVVQRMLSNQPHSFSSPPSTTAYAIQRKTEEEEPQQGNFGANRRSENRTGLPARLKGGIENLSGLPMDDVRVHYNSPKPAQVQALAYTQGTDIHLGPDEEEHLPHEAWHVVQQKQGRVRPTLQAKGLPVNDDAGLEHEADRMGAQALQIATARPQEIRQGESFVARPKNYRIIQRVEDSKNKRRELWGTKDRSEIKQWKIDAMAAFWALVKTKLAPTYGKVNTVNIALGNVHSYMIHADATPARAELDALRNAAPAIQNAPVIRTTNHKTVLSDLKARLAWIYARRNVHWDQAITTELNRRKDNLTTAEEWQIYGEALLADQNGQSKTSRWNTNATAFAREIKTVGDQANAALNAWLDDISARIRTINNLWTAAHAAVAGTYGTIPQATVTKLFIDYEPNMTRTILVNAVANNISGHQWGGVKTLNHNTYARELKINAMGGDDRVFSKTRTPTILDTIGPGLH